MTASSPRAGACHSGATHPGRAVLRLRLAPMRPYGSAPWRPLASGLVSPYPRTHSDQRWGYLMGGPLATGLASGHRTAARRPTPVVCHGLIPVRHQMGAGGEPALRWPHSGGCGGAVPRRRPLPPRARRGQVVRAATLCDRGGYHRRLNGRARCRAVWRLHFLCSGPAHPDRSSLCPKSQNSPGPICFPHRAHAHNPAATLAAHARRSA